jgi:hypothetical protein
MKKMLYVSSFLFFCFGACKNEDKETIKSENDADAARNFIRSTMDGDYSKARTFMLPDSQNIADLEVYERYYNEKMKPDEKQSYKKASINIHEIKNVNDSTSIILYSNSFFKKDTHQLKSVRINGQWLVDFKFYFEAKKDSLP